MRFGILVREISEVQGEKLKKTFHDLVLMSRGYDNSDDLTGLLQEGAEI